MPLSPKDYIARFGLELVILLIAGTAFITNFSLSAHANLLETKDNSVIFSFLRSNPELNSHLLASNNTTTILARTDRLVTEALAQSPFSGIVLTSASNEATGNEFTTIQENVIVKTNPADTDNFMRHGRTTYKVESGDSIVSIASSFGISPQTIMMENKLDETSILKPGQELIILPTTGISHKIAANETAESIAAKYKISEDDLLDANDIELPTDISVDDILVIPLPQVNMPVKPAPAAPKFVRTETGKVATKTASVPSVNAGSLSFVWPTATRGITQGFHKRHSGLDISNSQMVAIYAAEDGFVELSGWQAGYGNSIIINHGNGFKTLYGHASQLHVSAGDKVTRGQVIAKQGRTGRVSGPTGIHLHFEIIRNGAKVNPLTYVKP